MTPDGGPSIFCGDTNVTGLKEVLPLLDAGLKDAWNVMHPNVKPNSMVKGATYNITYPRGTGAKKRYDRIFFHPGISPEGLEVQQCEPVDADLVDYVSSDASVEPYGRDGKHWISDHLPVQTNFIWNV